VSYLWLGYSLHGKTEGSKRHLITMNKTLIKSFCLTFDIRTGSYTYFKETRKFTNIKSNEDQ